MKRMLGMMTLLAGAGLGHAQVMAPPMVSPLPAATAAADGDCSTGWVDADYLLWWVKGARLPVPLVTRGSAADPVPAALGQPTTQILYGGDTDDFGAFNGARVKAGMWLDADRQWAFELGGFVLERRSTFFGAADDGTTGTFLGIPANVVNLGGENIYNVAGPGFNGQVNIQNTLRLWGLEANTYRNVMRDGGLSVNAVTGLRYLNLRENLDITTAPLTPGAGPFTGGFDHFGTHNDFYGGQLGAQVGYQAGRLGLDLLARVSLGVINQGYNVNGQITLDGVTSPGNSLTQLTNIGDRTQTRFAVVPEVGVKARYQLTDRLAASVGYDFLFIDRAARPGDQIDRNINATQAPQFGGVLVGPPVPQPRTETSSFFAHGFNLGLTFSY